MKFLFIAFFSSLIITWILIHYQHLHEKISSDIDLLGPQKFHTKIVPRIGGISIMLAILITGLSLLILDQMQYLMFLAQVICCAIPSFFIGLMEDITKKVSIKKRLVVTSISAALAIHFLNIFINNIQVPGFDWLLSIPIISLIITILAITGLTNAYNIIDGFNGLASMIGIISLSAIGFVAFIVNDSSMVLISLIVIGAIFGFFIWNYPRGMIFLGDGGAYFIGFIIGTLSILLVNRNITVSPWFAFLINVYPIFETLFTIWRRKIYQGKNPALPDAVHFHSLIYRRITPHSFFYKVKKPNAHFRNAKTAPYLWILSSLAVIPAIIWWETTWILQCFTLLFCISYVWIYKSIISFKAPKVMMKF